MAIIKCGRCKCYEECNLVVVKGVMENLKKYDATELVTVKEVVNGKMPKCYAQGDENSEKSAYESLGKSDEFLEESVEGVVEVHQRDVGEIQRQAVGEVRRRSIGKVCQ